MATSLAEVRKLAFELTPEDREILAEELTSSLEQPELTEVDQAWIRESERRYQEVKEGKVTLVPVKQAFAQIDKEFGWS